MKKILCLPFALALFSCSTVAQTISFRAADGLEVTADLYMAHGAEAPFIVLFHMASSSRGEYKDIAPRLNKLGFNVMAVDQRSGGSGNGKPNETAARARSQKLGTSYWFALPDMQAAIAEARAKYAKGKLLIWGSSYSAGLVLKLAGDDPGLCDGVLAFSPSEYFSDPTVVTVACSKITVPVFITSQKYEKDDWSMLYDALKSSGKVAFLPEAIGAHGSPALDPDSPGAEEYWKAVTAFLAPFTAR